MSKLTTTHLTRIDQHLNAPEAGAVHSPSTQSIVYTFDDAQDIVDAFQGKKMAHVYGRSSSPSVAACQNVLNSMFNGIGCVAFSTGMAAISSSVLSLCKAGDHLIVSQFLFGNTRSFFQHLQHFDIAVSFVDVTDVNAIADAIQPNTRIVFSESLANPLTQVVDIAAVQALCHEHGVLFMLDTTMTPPTIYDTTQNPADVIIVSMTKYIAGQGQVLGGAMIDLGTFDWTQWPHIDPRYQVADTKQWGLTQVRKKGLRDIGATLGTEAATAILLGLETLDLRYQQCCANARAIADFLNQHDSINDVYHPSLATHTQHELTQKQFGSAGALLSFNLAETDTPVAFLNRLKLILTATHLGDVRTLGLPVAQTIFFEFSADERNVMGISDQCVRLSVGTENTQDLLNDLTQALAN